MMRAPVALLALLAACARGDDGDCRDLRGAWRIEGHGELHAVRGRTDPERGRIDWELYPMWREPAAGEGQQAAPGVIDLHRDAEGNGGLRGTYRRRYQQGAAVCVAETAALLEGCTLTVQPPPPPLDYVSCFPGVGVDERWTLRR